MLLRVISVRLNVAEHNFISDRTKSIRNPVNGSTLSQQDFSFTYCLPINRINIVQLCIIS